jgi:hypothetical protein
MTRNTVNESSTDQLFEIVKALNKKDEELSNQL